MSKTLVIAEKPSVARDIAKVLKCTGKGDGFLYSEKFVVSWAIGHLVSLAEPEEYDVRFKRWTADSLPIVPQEIKLVPISKTKKQLTILRKLMNDKEISELVCATDSGREGELIFRYIYNICKCKKPFKRLWISSMTDEAISNGFKGLKDGAEYDNLYMSAKCRSEADWLVGINASRAYTIKYNALISIGRVQTPTLAILVEKQKEINAFVSKDYWEVVADFSEFKGTWFDRETNESKLFDLNRAEKIVAKVKGQSGIVDKIENEEKRQASPLLYDLTDLQRDCNRRFGFSAKKTLEVAQSLYEKRKAITYPRTDSRYLTEDMVAKLPKVMEKLYGKAYDLFLDYLKSLPKLPINKRIVDGSKVSDHHAIIPTEVRVNTSSFSADEWKVYDLVVRRFLAVFYPQYVYNVTKIISVVCGESFLTKGSTIIKLGYMELYKDIDKEAGKKGEDEEDVLPNVSEGQAVNVSEAHAVAKKTKPPKPYSEATLLSAMENAGRFVDDEALKEQLKESGLGTPATRAAIIERLLQVGYVERKGKSLIPTEKGMTLIEVVPVELKSPETTGKWEKGLSSIAKGKMNNNKFMESIIRYVHFLVGASANAPLDVVFPVEERRKGKVGDRRSAALGKCPLCEDGEVFENTKAFFCSEWKSGCGFTIWKNSLERNGIVLNSQIIKKLLKGSSIQIEDKGKYTLVVRSGKAEIAANFYV